MQHGRKRLISALAGTGLIGALALSSSTPAHAEPDIDDVKEKVDRLYHEAEQASERFNDARLELADLQGDLTTLRADQTRQDQRLSGVRDQVADSIVTQYTGQSLSAAGEVFVSDDPGSFLSSLTTMAAFNDIQGQLLGSYTTEVKALQLRREATESRIDRVEQTKEEMAEEKAAIDEKFTEAQELLDQLEAEEREAIVSRSSTTREAPVPTSVPSSGRAGAAVAYAMSQVGDAYVYGAAGPSAFDCSGLTMMAWAQAGVSLPHSSSAQFSSGPQVAEGDLQPGDLVFYYSPISHVGMYIGNGQIVHAANPGSGVTTASLHSMPYVGAVRPG